MTISPRVAFRGVEECTARYGSTVGGKQDRQFLTVYYVLHCLYLRLRNVSLQLTGVILLTDLQLNFIAYFERAQSAVKGGAHMFYKDVHLHNAL